MKNNFKAAISLILSLLMLSALALPSFAQETPAELKFNEEGKFVIMQIADMQDDIFVSDAMLTLMTRAFADIKPDLVVFTGDNTAVPTNFLGEAAIKQALAPIVAAGIPYGYVYGNHDTENLGNKASYMQFYKQNGKCLSYNAYDSKTSYGNCNLPILSSDGTDTAFNIWLIDSGMYHPDGGYDIVHDDQVEWYKNTSSALEAEAGHKVNSLVFQHIIVPEIFDYLETAPESSANTKFHKGRNANYFLKFKADANLEPDAALNEFPCPPNLNTNEFSAMVERGDVIGIATGHDHVNSFILHTNEGIDLIQSAGITFQSYGNDTVRGFRTITLDENDTTKYETKTYTYYDYMTQKEIDSGNNSILIYLKGFFVALHSLFTSALRYLNIFSA